MGGPALAYRARSLVPKRYPLRIPPAEMARLYAREYLSLAQVARRAGVSTYKARTVLRRQGVKMRSRSEEKEAVKQTKRQPSAAGESGPRGKVFPRPGYQFCGPGKPPDFPPRRVPPGDPPPFDPREDDLEEMWTCYAMAKL